MHEVVVNGRVLDKAKHLFPADGDPEGRPRYKHFVEGPLAAAQFRFEREFDQLGDLSDPIKGVHTSAGGFFGPCWFYAMLVKQSAKEVVEIVDFTYDSEYWETIADD